MVASPNWSRRNRISSTRTRGKPDMRIIFGALLALSLSASAAPAAEPPRTIPLWPEGAPGALGRETGDDFHAGDRPTLTVYRADPAKATGAAVVVCPGGGYGFLATEH